MRSHLLLALLIGSLLGTGPTSAHPTESFPPEARPEGMAGAYAAIAEGPFAVCWNAAGLALAQPLSFAPYARRDLSPPIGNAPHAYACGASGHWGRFGLGFAMTAIGGGGDSDGGGFPSGRTLWFGGGLDLVGFAYPSWRNLRWGVGATLKHVSELSGSSYGVHCEGIPSGWNIDLGSLLSYRVGRGGDGVEPVRTATDPPRRINRYRVEHIGLRRTDDGAFAGARAALVLRNLVGQAVDCVAGELYRPMDPSVRLGGALEGGLGVLRPLGRLASGSVSIEEEIVHRRDDPLVAHEDRTYTITRVGAEATLLGVLAGRAGRVNDPGRDIDGWSWGAGLGLDLWDPGGGLGQCGARIDFASAAPVEGAPRPEHWTFTFWVLY